VVVRRVVAAAGVAAVAGLLLACGAVKQARVVAEQNNELKTLGLAYHGFHEDNGTGPPDREALLKWARQKMPAAVPVIEQTGPEGKYTLVYGRYNFDKDFPKGTSFTALAWETKAATPAGRSVLMGDGSARLMNEAEFAAAPRPGAADAGKAQGGKVEAGDADRRANDLRAIGEVYHRYWASHKGKGPVDRGELIRFAEGLEQPRFRVAHSAGGEFHVYFGCDRSGAFPGGEASTVLGYENQPGEGGRLVLTADGKVWRMTEQAFAAAPRPRGAKQ
jgi:hypothetical protein